MGAYTDYLKNSREHSPFNGPFNERPAQTLPEGPILSNQTRAQTAQVGYQHTCPFAHLLIKTRGTRTTLNPVALPRGTAAPGHTHGRATRPPGGIRQHARTLTRTHASTLVRSLVRSHARSLGTLAHSRARSLARSLLRSHARIFARSHARSLAPSTAKQTEQPFSVNATLSWREREHGAAPAQCLTLVTAPRNARCLH